MYLVCCSVSETGEKRQEPTANGGIGHVPEDDLVQVRGGLNLYAHGQMALPCIVPLYRTLPMLLISRFAVVSTGWKTMSSAIPAHPAIVRLEN